MAAARETAGQRDGAGRRTNTDSRPELYDDACSATMAAGEQLLADWAADERSRTAQAQSLPWPAPTMPPARVSTGWTAARMGAGIPVIHSLPACLTSPRTRPAVRERTKHTGFSLGSCNRLRARPAPTSGPHKPGQDKTTLRRLKASQRGLTTCLLVLQKCRKVPRAYYVLLLRIAYSG